MKRLRAWGGALGVLLLIYLVLRGVLSFAG